MLSKLTLACIDASATADAQCCCPAADVNLLKVPEGKRDEVYVFLSDILPTAWHANELGQVGEGDRVAIWGAGPGAYLLCLVMSDHLDRRHYISLQGTACGVEHPQILAFACSTFSEQRAEFVMCSAAMHSSGLCCVHAVGLLTAHLAKVRGAKQIISIDCVDYRLDRVKQVCQHSPIMLRRQPACKGNCVLRRQDCVQVLCTLQILYFCGRHQR
jgi:hypothetical protein